MLIFKLALTVGEFPSSSLLCQESFCFTNMRSAGYADNTGIENQCQYEFPHFPVTVPTHDGFPLVLILYEFSFLFFVSFQMKISWKEMCHEHNPPTWYLLTSKASLRLSNITGQIYSFKTSFLLLIVFKFCLV